MLNTGLTHVFLCKQTLSNLHISEIFSLDVSEASVEDQLINLDAPVSKETDSKDLFIV